METLLSTDGIVLQTLERRNLHVGDDAVQLLGRLFILVSLAGHTHAHARRHVLDTVRPQKLVQTGVDTDVPVSGRAECVGRMGGWMAGAGPRKVEAVVKGR